MVRRGDPTIESRAPVRRSHPRNTGGPRRRHANSNASTRWLTIIPTSVT